MFIWSCCVLNKYALHLEKVPFKLSTMDKHNLCCCIVDVAVADHKKMP